MSENNQYHRVRMVSLRWWVQYFKLEQNRLVPQPHMDDGPYLTEKEARNHILEGWLDADKSKLPVGDI